MMMGSGAGDYDGDGDGDGDDEIDDHGEGDDDALQSQNDFFDALPFLNIILYLKN